MVPVIFFLAGMAMFANRSVICVQAKHVLCFFIIVSLTRPPTFEILCYFLIGLLTIWIGCSSVFAQLPKPKGDYSYGVYIYSFPIQQAVVSLWPRANPYELFGVAVLAIMPCAIASWHMVELPAQKAGKNLAHVLVGKARMEDGLFTFLRRNWQGVALPVMLTLAAFVGLHIATAQLNAHPVALLPVQIVAYGPIPVVHGQPFNVQPNGGSAIWVKLDQSADKDFNLVLAGYN